MAMQEAKVGITHYHHQIHAVLEECDDVFSKGLPLGVLPVH